MVEMGPANLDILLELHVMATMYRHRTGDLSHYRLYHLYIKGLKELLRTGGSVSLIYIFIRAIIGDLKSRTVLADNIRVLYTIQVLEYKHGPSILLPVAVT